MLPIISILYCYKYGEEHSNAKTLETSTFVRMSFFLEGGNAQAWVEKALKNSFWLHLQFCGGLEALMVFSAIARGLLGFLL